MTMTIDHPRFPEFRERLAGPEGIDLQPNGSDRAGGPRDTTGAVAILRDMGLHEAAIASSLSYFAARGGFSDRDIVLELGITAGDEIALAALERIDEEIALAALEHVNEARINEEQQT